MPDEKPGSSFQDGMRVSGVALQDPPPEEWTDANWKRMKETKAHIHAMILLANDDSAQLTLDTSGIINELKGNGIAHVFVDTGKRLYRNDDQNDEPVEHFGYIDGISDPVFLKKDLVKP